MPPTDRQKNFPEFQNSERCVRTVINMTVRMCLLRLPAWSPLSAYERCVLAVLEKTQKLIKYCLLLRGQVIFELGADYDFIDRGSAQVLVFRGPDGLEWQVKEMETGVVDDVDSQNFRYPAFAGAAKGHSARTEIKNPTGPLLADNECICQSEAGILPVLERFFFHEINVLMV